MASEEVVFQLELAKLREKGLSPDLRRKVQDSLTALQDAMHDMKESRPLNKPAIAYADDLIKRMKQILEIDKVDTGDD